MMTDDHDLLDGPGSSQMEDELAAASLVSRVSSPEISKTNP